MTYHLSVVPECNTPFLGPSMTAACPGSQFFLFMTLLDTLVRAKQDISGLCSRVKSIPQVGDDYDFIVVGGGTAGSVVAARLSENPEWNVLLLEAGPDEPPAADVPSFAMKLLGTDIDWKYNTTGEKYACNGQCHFPRGKVLGGTSVLNGMTYLRGVPKDFDNWVALGNEGWSWKEVEPFFLRSENNGDIQLVGRKHHSTGGPLTIERGSWVPDIISDFLAAAKEKGYAVSEDLNGDNMTGFGITQAFIKDGVRESSSRAFLRPIRNRPNLHISLDTTVTRIIVENGRAVGVEYLKNGESRSTRASHEVIVSCGAIGSPRLLLNSGIGPKEHLESVNVQVVKDLPGVGNNFHAHSSMNLIWTINSPDYFDLDWAVATEYVAFRKGPMSTTGLNQLTCSLPSSQTSADFPDIQIYFGGYQATCATTGEIGSLQSNGRRSITVIPTVTHPRSRGTIRLASNDPREYPVITGNFLQDKYDIDVLIEAIDISVSLANTTAMAKHDLTLKLPHVAACSQYTPLSKEYLKCVIPYIGMPIHHLAGTCKMGRASDPLAVVDPRLRVHGVKGLRVADSSIMPVVTSENTAAPITMIGERCAAFIKEDWGVSEATS